MKLVIDANIVFAALIKEGFTSDLIASPKLELYCPAYIFEEFEKYKTYLLNKTHREPDEFMRYYQVLKRNIKTIALNNFEENLNEAREITPDPKDFFYIALAMKLDCPLWSNDVRLKQQTKVSVYSTSEIISMIYHQ